MMDVQYGALLHQKGALVFPKNYPVPSRQAPGVVFLHGGAWFAGDYTDSHCLPRAQYFVGMTGLMAFAANYRLVTPSDYGIFDAIMDDIDAAVAYLAGQQCVDPAKMFTVGFSAGGNLAVSYGAHRNAAVLPTTVGAPIDLEAWLAWQDEAGRNSYLAMWEKLYGSPTGYIDMSPVQMVGPASLLLHGQSDNTVPAQINQAYAANQVALGIPTRLLELPGDHALTGQEDTIFSELLRFIIIGDD